MMAVIDGHTSTGIQVGEPGQANLDGPAVNIAAVSITGEQHDLLHGDIANVTAATTTDPHARWRRQHAGVCHHHGRNVGVRRHRCGYHHHRRRQRHHRRRPGLRHHRCRLGQRYGDRHRRRINDSYNGGSGTDTIDYSALTAAQPISVNLGTGVAGGASIGTDTLTSFENLTGGAGDDSLFGSNANNVIHGGDGADNIVGDVGSDTLFGDGGNDTLNGGVNDFGISPAAANDILNGGTGTDNFRFEGRFGADKITGWTDDLTGPGTDGEDIVLVNYAGHTPLIADDGLGNAVITIEDGSVSSSVTVEGILASQLHVINAGSDIIIH